jgi:hypothetical protein
MDALKVSPVSVVTMFLLSSIKYIHLQMVDSVPCLSAACVITSKEVLSKAPSLSRKAAKAISLCSIALSMCAVSVDLPVW